MNKQVDELYKQIEKVIYDEVYIHGHEALLYPEGERQIKKLLQSRRVTRVFGVFDTQGKFLIAYPRKILADAYLCAHAKPENYQIKELDIEVIE